MIKGSSVVYDKLEICRWAVPTAGSGVIYGTMCRFFDNRRHFPFDERDTIYIYFIVSEKLRPNRERRGSERRVQKIRLSGIVASKYPIYKSCESGAAKIGKRGIKNFCIFSFTAK